MAPATPPPRVEVVWNPLALTGVFALLFAWAMAGLVYFTSPGSAINRRLGLLLFVEGTAFGAATGLQFLMADAAEARAWRAVSILASLSMPFLYLLFLATLDAPLARPLKRPWVQAALAACAILVPLAWFLHPERFVGGMVLRNGAWYGTGGPWFKALLNVLLVTYFYGFAVALAAFLRAPKGSAIRDRARAVTIAFGTRDVLFVAQLASAPLWSATPTLQSAFVIYSGVIPIVFSALFAYAILKAQVFDIDLRLKKGLRGSLVASTFVLVFFLASEATESLITDQAGVLGGFLAAGLLAFATRPLENAATRVANAAFPGVSSESDYLDMRRQDVYRAAVESALEEGGVSAAERGILRRLHEKLGIDAEIAEEIERKARSRYLAEPQADPA